MATDSAAPEISGPRKRKLSTKATTNGDPQARKRQKSGTTVKKTVTAALTAVKNGVTAALTKKKTSKTATGTSKAASVAPNRASAKGREKNPQKRASVEDIADDSDDIPSNPPQNPKHILEAVDGSDDDDQDPAPELIEVDDDDDDDEEDDGDEDETNLEAPEESAEAELSMGFIFVSNRANHKSIRAFIKRLDITYLCLLQTGTPG